MSLYLSRLEVLARVHQGKEVEQWLSYTQQADYSVIRWLSLHPERPQAYGLTYFESFDEGEDGNSDVREFSVLDPENDPYGTTHHFASVDEAVAFAVEHYGASADKFVAGGMLTVEYTQHAKSQQP
jgi:hypothetical protein